MKGPLNGGGGGGLPILNGMVHLVAINNTIE